MESLPFVQHLAARGAARTDLAVTIMRGDTGNQLLQRRFWVGPPDRYAALSGYTDLELLAFGSGYAGPRSSPSNFWS